MKISREVPHNRHLQQVCTYRAGSKSVSVIQDKDDDAVLLALDTASELGMSKLLACCERRMALKPCQDSMIPNLWQRLPISSTSRIASCLSMAMAAAFEDSGRKYGDPFTRLYYEYVPSCQRFWEMAKE